MPSWIQCPDTLKLIPREEYSRHEEKFKGYVQADIDPFVSPIDGSIISSRRTLRDHNKRHGVTDYRDYGDSWFKKKEKERAAELSGTSKKARAERVEDIQRSLHRFEG